MPEQTPQKRLVLKIQNRIPEIAAVEARFHEFAENNGIQVGDRQMLSIVLDDLLNNVISYAYPQGGDHLISVDLSLQESCLVLIVEDGGIPFNPFDMEAPDTDLPLEARLIGGLGIHLIRESMDEYRYERRADRNVVTLVKQLSGFETAESVDGSPEHAGSED